MKPRQRTTQKQKSRLHARHNDHRDILYYNEELEKTIYHTGLYWTTRNQNSIILENLAWVKYPKTALIGRERLGSSRAKLGYIDVDRQFAFYIPAHGGNTMSGIYHLDDITVYIENTASSVTCIYVTEDGIVWQSITDLPTLRVIQGTVFGEHKCGNDNTLVTIYVGNSYKRLVSYHFTKNENTDRWEVQAQNAAITEPTISRTAEIRYMGCTDNGFILGKEESSGSSGSWKWQLFTYEVNVNGNADMICDPVPPLKNEKWFDFGGEWWRVCQTDDILFCSVRTEYKQNPNESTYTQVKAYWSTDGGITWDTNTFYSARGESYSSYVASRTDICNRDGVIYQILGQRIADSDHEAYTFRMFEYDTSLSYPVWQEIILPKWLDMPILDEFSGRGIEPYESNTVRIAIDPSQTSNYDYRMFDLVASSSGDFLSGSGNILYKDGEYVDDETFFNFGLDGDIHAYFDNKYLAESTKAFAWISRHVAGYTDDEGADYVIPYDYCAPT